jgi:DNA repair protein RecN (Recombination protein N)
LSRDARGLERIEERLFALRALARKHGVAVDALPEFRAATVAKIASLDDGGANMKTLERRAIEARESYVTAASALGQSRRRASKSLDAAVAKELPPLRLEKARFITIITQLPESDWGEHGAERVGFEVATNPGTQAGPLARIASGGELARFMLALKMVLAESSAVPTLVFDEVDSGIGGAAAALVGERLHRLAKHLQVLVVTHSPQVAARGAHHWRVAKVTGKRGATTKVEHLSENERREEIARMLSGTAVTAEARAAAASLLLPP